LIIRRLAFFLSFLLLGLPCVGQTREETNATSIKFEVLSVREMSPEESLRKLSDVIGTDLSVKLRLSNTGPKTIYFYAWKDDIAPWGHTVKKTNNSLVWLVGGKERESKISPGIDPVVSGTWLVLPEGAAIEWEVFDTPALSEEIHAKTLFMKVGKQGSVVEVLSDFYKVMARNSQPI
jgi:hypothetical protein